MSIVREWLDEARVVDLFAGSGALGLEAVSRGAAHADLVEIAPASLKAIARNVEELKAGELVTVRRADALRFVEGLGSGAYDLGFADPPYRLGLAKRVAEQWLAVPFAAVLGVEHESREAMPEGGDTRRYGDSAITFYGMR